METLVINNDDEELALTTINKYLEERIFDKKKKEICLVFSKKPTKSFFKLVLLAFYDYKSAYLKMIKYEKEKKTNTHKTIIHAGEEVYFNEPLIVIGNVNKDANLYIKSNIVFIGDVKGNIYLLDDNSSIYADKFTNAIFIDSYGRKKVFTASKRIINHDEMEAL